MSNFFQVFMRLVAITGFTFIFILVSIWLEPSKMHKHRKVSTAFLKYTYLIYLVSFLGFIYFLLFTKIELHDYFDIFNYSLFVLSALIPTITILIRRKIHLGRTFYNLVIGFLNLGILIFILHFFYKLFISA